MHFNCRWFFILVATRKNISKSVKEALFFFIILTVMAVLFLRRSSIYLNNGLRFGPLVSEDVKIIYGLKWIQRLYITISKSYLFYSLWFGSPHLVTTASWSRAVTLLVLGVFWVGGGTSCSDVLVRCRPGWGWEVVKGCAVYTVYRLSLASLPLA